MFKMKPFFFRVRLHFEFLTFKEMFRIGNCLPTVVCNWAAVPIDWLIDNVKVAVVYPVCFVH